MFYEFETDEYNSLLMNNGGGETFEQLLTQPAGVQVHFDAQFVSDDFRIGHNLIILDDRRDLDRESRNVYVLPVWAELEGERTYTTVSYMISCTPPPRRL